MQDEDWKNKYFGLQQRLADLAPAARDFIDPGDRCVSCNGSGYLIYDTAATWRGGPAAACMKRDVCSYCWGSGSKRDPWPSHHLLGAGP